MNCKVKHNLTYKAN